MATGAGVVKGAAGGTARLVYPRAVPRLAPGVLLLAVATPAPAPTLVPERPRRELATATSVYRPGPGDVATPRGLPPIGRWMLYGNLQPASWLGVPYLGKAMREPINLILVDTVSTSGQEARERLVAALAAAGFPARGGHSSGYRGFIGDATYPQLPEGRGQAFSDRPSDNENDHGRIFGPHRIPGGWLFVGAVSREKVVHDAKVGHGFVSFNRARDDFVLGLQRAGAFRAVMRVKLGNAVPAGSELTTGDHDGYAVVLRAKPQARP